MKKIKENKVLSAVVFAILASIVGTIVYPLVDKIMCKNLFHTTFYYSEWKHIVQPVIVSIFVAFLVYLPFFSCKNK